MDHDEGDEGASFSERALLGELYRRFEREILAAPGEGRMSVSFTIDEATALMDMIRQRIKPIDGSRFLG